MTDVRRPDTAPGWTPEVAAAVEVETASDALPRTEWMVVLADHPAAARRPREVAVVSSLRPLDPRAGEEVLAHVSVGFRDRPVLALRRGPDGPRVRSGLDLSTLATDPTLARVLARVVSAVEPAARTLGVGVVGYGPFGGMGHTHGLAATETAGLEFVAAADRDRARLKAATEDFPGIAVYEDVAELARDEDVDVAIVAVPPAYHAELGRQLLDAGKHVVLEKPMCLTAADADDLLARAADAGRVVTVHQSRRWDRDFLTLRRVVEQGLLGEVFSIETFVGTYDHPCREWHSDVGPSGGAIYDWGSHHVDWILRLYGGELPRTVRCTGHKRVWHDITNLDQLTLHLTWADGREAMFRQSDVAAIRRPKFHVQGTLGTLEGHYRPLRTERLEPGRGYVDHEAHHAEAPVDLRVVTHETGVGLSERILPPAPHPGWGFHVNLADHLLLGEPLDVAPSQPRDVVAVLEAGHRSAAEGGTLVHL